MLTLKSGIRQESRELSGRWQCRTSDARSRPPKRRPSAPNMGSRNAAKRQVVGKAPIAHWPDSKSRETMLFPPITDRAAPPLGAAAAILVAPDRRYLLQHRDNRPDIWDPDHWGLFGGSIDPGETPEQALAR